MVMNSADANYSYGSLQRVFEAAFQSFPAPWNQLNQVLMLGMAGGCLVEVLHSQEGFSAPITAVELDPVVIELGRKYFGEAYAGVKLVHGDALRFMENPDLLYDLIIVDLFVDRDIAPGTASSAFIAQIHDALNPGGMVYHNLILSPDRLQEVKKYYQETFNRVESIKLLGLNDMIVAYR